MKNSKKITLLIICVALFMVVLNYTYARLTSSASGTASVDNAVFLSENNVSEVINVSLDNMNPGDTKSYSFAVKNFNGTKRSEVTITYDISIIKSDNLPLNVTLYKNGVETNILDTDLKSLNNELDFNIDQTDNYTLNIYWDSTNNSYEYSDQIDYIDIEVDSKQKI